MDRTGAVACLFEALSEEQAGLAVAAIVFYGIAQMGYGCFRSPLFIGASTEHRMHIGESVRFRFDQIEQLLQPLFRFFPQLLAIGTHAQVVFGQVVLLEGGFIGSSEAFFGYGPPTGFVVRQTSIEEILE